MSPKEHVAYGAAASAALYPFFREKTFFFFTASVLIDLDHYIDYLYYARFRDWRIKSMFAFHGILAKQRDNPDILALEAFHTAEFLFSVLAVAVYYRSTVLYLTFAGFIFHMGLDLFRLAQWKRVDIRALSFVEYVIRKHRMIRSGLHPEKPFFDVYAQIPPTRSRNAENALKNVTKMLQKV